MLLLKVLVCNLCFDDNKYNFLYIVYLYILFNYFILINKKIIFYY